MQAAMSNLVDARSPRRSGVPLANGKQEQPRASIHGTAEKHRPPSTSWLRDVELHTARQSCSVASLRVAALEPCRRYPVCLEAPKHRLDGCPRSVARAGEIVGKRPLIDVDLKGRSRGLFGHLPLAVGGQVAKMLVELLRRQAFSSRALKNRLHRGLLRRPLWSDHEPTIGKGLLDHEGSLYVAAELDVTLLHGEIMAEGAVEAIVWALMLSRVRQGTMHGLICASALLATACFCPALSSADSPGTHVNFWNAKRQLTRFAAMVCPYGTCPSRVYACERRSARRVDCRSETLVNNESIPVENESEAVPNELCSWNGVATPFQGSSTKLLLQAKHFACRATKSRNLPPRNRHMGR